MAMDKCRLPAVFLSVLLCLFANAQHLPEGQQAYSRIDIFGGYSYLNADLNHLFSISRQSASGWEVSFSLNTTKWVAWESDLSGYYKTKKVYGQTLGVNDHSFASGPRLNLRPLFVHALLGVDHLKGSAIGTTLSQDSIAGAFGGGVQWRLTSHLAVRSSVDYVLTRHNAVAPQPVTQDNYRAGAGVVFSFGGESRSAHKTRTAEVTTSGTPVAGTSVARLGVVVVAMPDNSGSKIVEIAPGSVAAKARLTIGDVVNSVDGKPARSPVELGAQLMNRVSGEQIHIGYLSRGYWQTETLIVLP
jgi:hypothetical protein